MKHKFSLRTISLIMSVIICFVSLPMAAFAIESDYGTDSIEASSPSSSTTEIATSELQKEVMEMTDLREETVKHFRLEDGTYTAVQYEMPVHYLDDNGEWQDIDNTLSDSGSEYASSNARVKFVKKITGNESVFTLHEHNRKITMSLDGAKNKTEGSIINTVTEHGENATQLQKLTILDKISASIIYKDILDGVDLEYVVISSNIKENIIVKERLDSYTFSFTVALNNLDAELLSDGSVNIFDASTNESVYIIPKGYMYDADGEFSDAVTYSLTDLGNSKYTFTVSADPEWINSTDRTFPVTVDPPIYTAINTSVVDTHISPNSVSTSAITLKAGGTSTLYWKTTSLPDLPKSAYVSSALFTMHCTESAADNYLGIYQVTSDWDNTLTWSAYSSATNPSGIYSSVFVDFIKTQNLLEASPGAYCWNVTDIVKSWYEGTTNYGFAISSISGYDTSTAIFSSSESGAYTHHPRLCIIYKDMKGVEDYWSYSSHSVVNAGSGSINLATGMLSFAIPLLSTTDSLMPYTVSLVYSGDLAGKYYNYNNAEIPYITNMAGYGFKLNVNETIVERAYVSHDGSAVTYYVWSDSDGTEHYFYKDTDNVYRDEDGLLLTLEEKTSTYTITASDHSVRTFTKNASDSSTIKAGGFLSSVTDKNGNAIQFTYNANGQVTQISLKPYGVAAISFLDIIYNSSGMIKQITNSTAGETVKLYYSTTYSGSLSTDNGGYLRRVERVYSDETYISNYTYDSTGRLSKVRDEKSGYEITYTYDAGEKLALITEKAGSTSSLSTGQSVRILYQNGYTTVRTSGQDDTLNTTDDILTRYVFDNYGRAVSTYSTDSNGKTIYGATSGTYVSDNEKAKNSLESSVVVNGVSSNYLLNGGFEKIELNEDLNKYVSVGSLDYWTASGNARVATLSPFELYMGASSTATSRVSQNVFLPAGEYTLSMELNTSIYKDVIVTLKAASLNGGSTYTQEYGVGEMSTVSLNFTANNYVNGGERFTISISVTGGSRTESGAQAIIDDVMLSKGIGVNSFDLMQFGSFEPSAINSSGTSVATPSTFWTTSHGTLDIVNDGAPFNNTVCISGYLDEQRSVSQVIYRSDVLDYSTEGGGIGETTFRITGFAQGTHQTDNASSAFRLRVEVKYDNGFVKTETFDFNNAQTDWQFVSGTFTVAPSYGGEENEYGIVESITVYCDYFNQPGNAYFDNITVSVVDSGVAIYEYNDDGYPTYYRPSWWYREWYFYNDNNDLIKKITRDRSWIEYQYDSNHNLENEIVYTYTGNYNQNSGTVSGLLIPQTKTTYVYDGYGLLKNVKSFIPNEATTASDDWELVATTSNEYNTGNTKIFGSLATSTDSLGNVTRYFYDDTNGNLLAVINPDGSTGTVYSYDGSGRVTMVRPATYTPTSTTPYAPVNNEYAEYYYGSLGQLEYICTYTTQYNISYDTFGNTDSISVGYTTIVDYTYNANNGKLNTITYGNGFVERYVYDALDRIVEIWYNNVKRYEYDYDVNGNLYKVVDIANDMVLVYSYDDQNRVTKMIECDASTLDLNLSIWQSYNDQSLIQSVIYSTAYGSGNAFYHNYSFTYNSQNNLTYMSIDVADDYDQSGGITYAYDALQRATLKTVSFKPTDSTGISVSTEYEYKTVGTSTSYLISQYVSNVKNLANNSTVATNTYNYTYDANGNITAIRDGDENLLNKYYYDDIGQLIREDNAALGKAFVYTYDDAGNRTSKKTYELSDIETAVLGTLQSTETYSYPDNPEYEYWGDQLVSVNGNEIEYDNVGNPIYYYVDCDYTDNCLLFLEWEGRQLVGVEEYTNGDFYYTYEYNDEGIRISKTVADTEYKYTLNGSQIVAQEWDNKLMLFFYDESGSPIGYGYRTTSMAADTFYYYVFEKNLQGDIVAIYNTSGTKLVSYTYDAWGNVTAKNEVSLTGANAGAQYNPFRYRSYYYDEEVRLYYLNSRYYDPSTGRFLNADEILYLGANGDINSYNLYAYCSNKPIIYGDAEGNFVSTVVGAIVGGIFGGLSAASEGDNIWAGIAIGAGTGALSGLAVDVSIATGGIGGIAIAAIGGAIASGADYALTEIVNERKVDWSELAIEATVGAAFNLLSFGVGGGSMQKVGGNLLNNIKNNAASTIMSNTTREVAGQIVSKTTMGVAKNIAKNIGWEIVDSVLGSLGDLLFSEAVKRSIN